MRLKLWIAIATLVYATLNSTAGAKAIQVTACEAVASVRLADTTLEVQEAATFCKILGVIRPVPDSRIGFELLLPRASWNGRLKMSGNGGYSSALPRREMEAQLEAGYAVVATDTGHEGDGPEFAIGRPQSIIDWGHRAVHLTIVSAKELVKAFYGRAPQYAYFQGCSTGGHQALMEAQRYPEDFDGIIAGAPGHNRTHLNAGFLWQHRQANGILPAGKLPLIARAAFEACRAQNGGAAGGHASDPYLNDPLACAFDPAVLACRESETADCLTTRQIAALRSMYAGAHNPRTGARIYLGWPPSTESLPDGRGGWSAYWADPANPELPARVSFWRYWAFNDPQWDPRRFDFDRDMQRAVDAVSPVVDATNPDLTRFRARRGKLIHYHGTADPVVPYADSINYYERVTKRMHSTSDFYRLFLAPGFAHCFGGPGPAPVDLQQALEDWVERGKAPGPLLAKREALTRPLCSYPQIARHDGKGAPNEASSFKCFAPERAPAVPGTAK